MVSSTRQSRKIRVAYVSSYPPRECGIATFTRDLVVSIDELRFLAPGVVVAINEKGASYNYGRQVKFQIERDSIDSYLEAASWKPNPKHLFQVPPLKSLTVT